MARSRSIAMASGIMPEATPVQLVEAAARAGFDCGGMWIEPAAWTPGTTRSVKAALRDTGLTLLDVEVVWIRPGPHDPAHSLIVEIGAELGARNILCVSSDPDRSATRDKLGRLMELGELSGVRINLEFGLFTEVKTINAASGLLEELDSPAGALLIDALHWHRSGGMLEEITALPPRWLSYAQFCDAPHDSPERNDLGGILEEALDGRLFLGEGGLPLRELDAVLPATMPFAIEHRSRTLREAYPDLNERARVVLERSRAFLRQERGGARV